MQATEQKVDTSHWAYPAEKRGVVVNETPKRFSVSVFGRMGTLTFDKETCEGVTRWDRTFPNYKITAIMLAEGAPQ